MSLSKPRIEHGTFTVRYCNAKHPTAKCDPWFRIAPYESIKKKKKKPLQQFGIQYYK